MIYIKLFLAVHAYVRMKNPLFFNLQKKKKKSILKKMLVISEEKLYLNNDILNEVFQLQKQVWMFIFMPSFFVNLYKGIDKYIF